MKSLRCMKAVLVRSLVCYKPWAPGPGGSRVWAAGEMRCVRRCDQAMIPTSTA